MALMIGVVATSISSCWSCHSPCPGRPSCCTPGPATHWAGAVEECLRVRGGCTPRPPAALPRPPVVLPAAASHDALGSVAAAEAASQVRAGALPVAEWLRRPTCECEARAATVACGCAPAEPGRSFLCSRDVLTRFARRVRFMLGMAELQTLCRASISPEPIDPLSLDPTTPALTGSLEPRPASAAAPLLDRWAGSSMGCAACTCKPALLPRGRALKAAAAELKLSLMRSHTDLTGAQPEPEPDLGSVSEVAAPSVLRLASATSCSAAASALTAGPVFCWVEAGEVTAKRNVSIRPCVADV